MHSWSLRVIKKARFYKHFVWVVCGSIKIYSKNFKCVFQKRLFWTSGHFAKVNLSKYSFSQKLIFIFFSFSSILKRLSTSNLKWSYRKHILIFWNITFSFVIPTSWKTWLQRKFNFCFPKFPFKAKRSIFCENKCFARFLHKLKIKLISCLFIVCFRIKVTKQQCRPDRWYLCWGLLFLLLFWASCSSN